MTNKEALDFAKQEREAYKRKVEDGLTFYQRIVDYYDIVVDALEKIDVWGDCTECEYRKEYYGLDWE